MPGGTRRANGREAAVVNAKTILVLGGTGATGRRLVAELLARGHRVRAIVRASTRLPAELRGHPQLQVIEGSALELGEDELAQALAGCDAVASCLGHNLSLRGMFGPPRRLVTDSVARIHSMLAESRPERPVRLVLMCSAGVRNADLDEPVSAAQRFVLFLLRFLVPPHADNEQAAEYLRSTVGRDDAAVEWSVVRPDTLQEGDEVSDYELHASPTRSALFNAGETRRMNVAHFMARLATDDAAWHEWRYRMPVIYNSDKQRKQEGQ